MSLLKTYTVKSKNSENIWQFKFHLDGTLATFEILDGKLNQEQIEWLFFKGKFPYLQEHVERWKSKLMKNFEIVEGEPDLSFDAIWELYGYKVGRQEAEKAYKKLKPAEVIRCFQAVPGSKKFTAKKQTSMAYLSTFMNSGYYKDDWYQALKSTNSQTSSKGRIGEASTSDIISKIAVSKTKP